MQNTDKLSIKGVISKTAERKLEKLFEYLIGKWSVKIKKDFVEKLDSSIKIIKNQPEIFPESKKGKSLRKYIITKKRLYTISIVPNEYTLLRYLTQDKI